MNITHRLLRRVPPQFHTLVKRISYFSFGTGLTIFYAQIAHAQSPASTVPVRTPYSATTIIAAIIAAVITVFFLRGMYLVLTYASETYGLENEDEHLSTAGENNFLLLGAAFWLVGSAIIIASYGLGWQFLFLGPIICLLGPLVPIFAMRLDIKNYREILRKRTAERSIAEPDSEFVRRS
jgi:hypothetical protein